MLVDSAHDSIVFAASFLCGQIIGLIFDIFRSFRKNVKVSKTLLSFQDSIFCAIAFYLFYKTVYITNSGAVRWYVIAGAILGAVLYFSAESGCVMKILVFFWKTVLRILVFLWWTAKKIATPFLKAYFAVKNCIKCTFGTIGNGFRRFFIKKKEKTTEKER